MVLYPELGLDPSIGSDWESGCDKFATTAFIAGLGVQSKDLMFSISKNPQASMAGVLAKIEKNINDEEALLSK